MSELLVVKVGSSSLLDQGGRLDQGQFDRIAEQTERFTGDIAVVTSGAISAGCEKIGVQRSAYEDDYAGLRWLAAVGQPALMERWNHAYDVYDRNAAQLLVTPYELSIKHESVHFIETLTRSLQEGTVAIINENDAIADEEIKLGDNDRLSARIAAALGATGLWHTTSLVLLSDIDGLYENFGTEQQTLVTEVVSIADVRHLAKDTNGTHGTGGMHTKFDAAHIATSAGVKTYLAHAAEPNAIGLALSGKIGTYFEPKQVR